ncbi:hypothetical protein BJX65DRAFT_205829 [Aspergillus insuetus]
MCMMLCMVFMYSSEPISSATVSTSPLLGLKPEELRKSNCLGPSFESVVIWQSSRSLLAFENRKRHRLPSCRSLWRALHGPRSRHYTVWPTPLVSFRLSEKLCLMGVSIICLRLNSCALRTWTPTHVTHLWTTYH